MPGYELIGKEEIDEILDVFNTGAKLSRHTGLKVDEFERMVAEKTGVKRTLGVSSGTAALYVALKGMGIMPGDEVITQCHTFVATVEAIKEIGAVPVLTEIDKTLNMDPEDLEDKITEKTRAIIPVHMLGAPARMNEIMEISKEHEIPVLEDSAQAPFGKYFDKYLGSIGNAGIFSFDYGKLVTTGEGGMVLTDDLDIYLRCRDYSDHGHENNPDFPRGEDTRRMSGFNFNMMELQGALGIAQLGRIDYILDSLRRNKLKIKESLSEITDLEFREIADPEGEICDTLVFFVDNVQNAGKIAKKMKENNVNTKNLPDAVRWHFADTWKEILGEYDSYRGKNLEDLWKGSGEIIRSSVSVPIMINMDDSLIDNITDVIKNAYNEIYS